MERKKILIIAMFDSIHLARWLEQFIDQRIDFDLFPSKKFKYINDDLLKLIRGNQIASYRFARPYFAFKYMGFINYLIALLFRKLGFEIESILLKRVFKFNNYLFVHAIELQGAGYLYASLPSDILSQNQLILTNYGSDIFYFQNLPAHATKIRSVLRIARYYSGECRRDYELAISNNFTGSFLPCIPNAGGFENRIFEMNTMFSWDRNLIIAKCYGGEFGLGVLIIEALSLFLRTKPKVQILLYSVTDDVLAQVRLLKINYPNQINYHRVRDKVDRKVFLENFSRARLYIGASKSDGISTSFLEALCLGAYAIQTNTSCGNEWLDKGFIATLIDPDLKRLNNELNIYEDTDLLEKYRNSNLSLAQKILNDSVIKVEALKYYEFDKNI